MRSTLVVVSLVLCLALAGAAAAEQIVIHNVTLGEKESRVLTEIYWAEAPAEYTQSWSVSPESRVRVWDELGDVPFQQANASLNFTVRPPKSSTNKRVYIQYNTSYGLDSSLAPLYLHRLPFTSFTDTPTLYVFRNEYLFNVAPNYAGFNRSLVPGEMRILGKGGATFTAAYGPARRRYAHFAVFGLELDLGPVDNYYRVIPAVYGVQPPVITLPIVVLDEQSYTKRFEGDNSIGRYVASQGLLFVRYKPDINPEGYAPTVLHEAGHAWYDQLFPWDYAGTTWFNEGISKYIETAVQRALFYPHPEYFGESMKIYGEDAKRYYNAFLRGFVSFPEPVGGEYLTLPPQGTQRDLWNYYRYGNDYMLRWYAGQDTETVDFGYAYGTFMVARAIREKGITAFHAAIQNLSQVDHAVREPAEYRDIVTASLGTDFEPCKASSYLVLETCTRQVNQFLTLPTLGSEPAPRLSRSTELAYPTPNPTLAPKPSRAPTAQPTTTFRPTGTRNPTPTPAGPETPAWVFGLIGGIVLILFVVVPLAGVYFLWAMFFRKKP